MFVDQMPYSSRVLVFAGRVGQHTSGLQKSGNYR